MAWIHRRWLPELHWLREDAVTPHVWCCCCCWQTITCGPGKYNWSSLAVFFCDQSREAIKHENVFIHAVMRECVLRYCVGKPSRKSKKKQNKTKTKPHQKPNNHTTANKALRRNMQQGWDRWNRPWNEATYLTNCLSLSLAPRANSSIDPPLRSSCTSCQFINLATIIPAIWGKIMGSSQALGDTLELRSNWSSFAISIGLVIR